MGRIYFNLESYTVLKQQVDQRTGVPLLQRKIKEIGLVQPGGEKALGRLESSLPVSKEIYKKHKKEGNILYNEVCCDRITGNGIMVSNLKTGDLDWI